MSLTAKDIEEIIRLLDASTFDRLSLDIDGVKLEVERGSTAAPTREALAIPADAPADPSPAAVAPTPRAHQEPGLIEIASPLLGIYYRSPKPGEPAFIEVGQKVTADTVIGIVEVMKLMNSVHAGASGEVVKIVAQNGALVEHGEVLMLIRPEA